MTITVAGTTLYGMAPPVLLVNVAVPFGRIDVQVLPLTVSD